MSENPSDVPAGVAAHEADDLAPVSGPAPTTPPPPPTDSPAPRAPRLRERVFRIRAVLAVAAAGVIVGGAAGAGLTALTDAHGHGGARFDRGGLGHAPGMFGAPGMPGGPARSGSGMAGQVLPGQPGAAPPTGAMPPAPGQTG